MPPLAEAGREDDGPAATASGRGCRRAVQAREGEGRVAAKPLNSKGLGLLRDVGAWGRNRFEAKSPAAIDSVEWVARIEVSKTD